MDSLNHDSRVNVFEAFGSTSWCLGGLLSVDNPYFEGMVGRIYPPELQLSEANTAGAGAAFLDLHLSVADGFVSLAGLSVS